MEIIDRFDGVNDLLSNFYPAPVDLDGQTYPTVEHAFQSAKTTDPDERERIRLTPDPASAKRLGRQVRLRPDWETYRLDVMAELVEGNTWHDTFWGVCNGKGQNHLGRILMRVRAELRGDESV